LWSACLWRRQRAASGTPAEINQLQRTARTLFNKSAWAYDPGEADAQTLPQRRPQHRSAYNNPIFQQGAHRIIFRRAKAAGITAYQKNSGKLEVGQQIANHESPRPTKLYDRRQDEISLYEIERIAI
jgi:hypothetical protein